MQHIIFGAGLVGGYLYAVLRTLHEPAAMVARPSIREKLANGLEISDYQQHHALIDTPEFVSSEDEQPCGYLWITLKCTAIAGAVDEFAPFVAEDTVILCCQNGLGSEQIIKQRFPNNRVLRVMVMFNVTELAPGHLHRGSQGSMFIEAAAQLCPGFVERLKSPLLPVSSCSDMQALLWAKLQLNLANAVNALADIPVKAMLQQRDYRRCIVLLMSELCDVAKAKGIALQKLTPLPARWLPLLIGMPDLLFRLLGNRMLAIDPNVRTSMWWDIHNGRKTEIDFLNGAIVAEARRHGLPCPANARIVAMIHELECGARKAGISARELLAQLRRS